MKILLFGKNGQVGWELQRSLAPLGEVVALDFDSPDLCGDFTQLEGLARTVALVHPDVVVNAAAHTAVDKAQAEPSLARTLNALAPGVVAKAAADIGAWMLHYSTDYVFDGSGQQAWQESDPTGPLNVYGQTKLEGEQLVQAHCPHHLILRTSWVYAARGANFAKTMLRLGKERHQLQVIDDQFGAPTGAELLADVSAHLLRSVQARGPSRTDLAGLYHASAGGVTSWHGYASWVIQTALALGHELRVTPESVLPVPTSAFPSAARRPLNSRLDCSRLAQVFGLELPHWQAGVTRMLQEILSESGGPAASVQHL
jgi:dTDP-4-dehydrorhamnose reductase